MNEYSLENADFKRISLTQIKAFFSVLAHSQRNDTPYIREKYQKSAPLFDETFLFLTKLNIAEELDGLIRISDVIDIQGDLNSALLGAMFERGDRIAVLASYLRNFSLKDDLYIFKPSVQKNLETSGIRNLLLELAFLKYSDGTRTYSITDYGKIFFLPYLRRTSINQLEATLKKQDKLGLRAELEVLKYERKKLKKFPQLIKNIKHISRSDVAAGFDILSFSAVPKERFEKMCIEVKAVSGESFDFYWSINEIGTAKNYGSTYYLYLLPVVAGGKFDIKKLRIISNPYEQIYKGGQSHKIESVLFHVSSDL